MADDLTIKRTEDVEIPDHDTFPGEPYRMRYVEFSDGSWLAMSEAQFDAIHAAGMNFAANLIKQVQS